MSQSPLALRTEFKASCSASKAIICFSTSWEVFCRSFISSLCVCKFFFAIASSSVSFFNCVSSSSTDGCGRLIMASFFFNSRRFSFSNIVVFSKYVDNIFLRTLLLSNFCSNADNAPWAISCKSRFWATTARKLPSCVAAAFAKLFSSVNALSAAAQDFCRCSSCFLKSSKICRFSSCSRLSASRRACRAARVCAVFSQLRRASLAACFKTSSFFS